MHECHCEGLVGRQLICQLTSTEIEGRTVAAIFHPSNLLHYENNYAFSEIALKDQSLIRENDLSCP
jgi:hypothetical protein